MNHRCQVPLEPAPLRAMTVVDGTPVPMEDLVNHPTHYTRGKIEVLAFILDQELGFLAGNVLKYLCRYRYKGTPIVDLEKARFYLDRLIEQEKARAKVA